MHSEIREFSMAGGGFTRVQAVSLDRWEDLCFFAPEPNAQAFLQITGLYRDFIVPSYPWLYAKLAFFRLPEDIAVPEVPGVIAKDPLLRAALILRKGLHVASGTRFSTPEAEHLWHALAARGCTAIVKGLRPGTVVLPVSEKLGFLTKSQRDAAFKCNLGFFTMDRLDCMTCWDRLGTPIGLRVKDGAVLQPPLFRREALFVQRNGSVHIGVPQLAALKILIGGRVFEPGKNAELYARPEYFRTPFKKETELVIVNGSVLAVCEKGGTPVPSSGFVLRSPAAKGILPGTPVEYAGMEDLLFAVQVGNSAVADGVPVRGFRSRFWNIRRPFVPPTPPSLYPLDYKADRAPRMALGADAGGNPSVLFFEGRPKFGDDPESHSRGASLMEVADLSASFGLTECVNLDGGGSAQILLNGRRALSVSDRDPNDLSERERAVPEGLCVI